MVVTSIWNSLKLVNKILCVTRASVNLLSPILRSLRTTSIAFGASESLDPPEQCMLISWSESSGDVALVVPCRFQPEEPQPRPDLDENERQWFEHWEGKAKLNNEGIQATSTQEAEETIIARMRDSFWAAQPWWKRSNPLLDIVAAREVDIEFPDGHPVIASFATPFPVRTIPIDTSALASTTQDEITRLKFDSEPKTDRYGRYAHLSGDPDAVLAAINADSSKLVNASFKLAMLESQQFAAALKQPTASLSYNLTKGLISTADGYPGLVYDLKFVLPQYTDSILTTISVQKQTPDGQQSSYEVIPHMSHPQLRSVHVSTGIVATEGLWRLYALLAPLLYISLVTGMVTSGWWLDKFQAVMTFSLTSQWIVTSLAIWRSGWRVFPWKNVCGNVHNERDESQSRI